MTITSHFSRRRFLGSMLGLAGSTAAPTASGVFDWPSAATGLAGLLCDASTPVPFGTHLLLFAAAHTVIYNLRDRVPRDQTGTRVIIALLANLGLFLVFSFFLIGRSPAPAEVWPRLIFDLACSQVFLALVAPWFFALQTRALELAGLENRSLF